MDDYIPLNITIKSATVFKNVTYFNRMHLYAVASDGNLSKRTNIDKRGGSNPFWWSDVMFEIQESKLVLEEENNLDDSIVLFRVMCRRVIGFDEEIGRVRLRVKDLFDHYMRSNSSSHDQGGGACENVAFSICSPRSGKITGVLKLSYMFGSGDYKGIMNNRVSSVPLLPSAPWPEHFVVPSASCHEDLDPCHSTYGSVQGHYGYNSARPVPSAPYLPDEGLRFF